MLRSNVLLVIFHSCEAESVICKSQRGLEDLSQDRTFIRFEKPIRGINEFLAFYGLGIHYFNGSLTSWLLLCSDIILGS